jgi:acyl transferase domain-containing protein/threonine dehydrogenase-like Zn-dependent dehydrogenase
MSSTTARLGELSAIKLALMAKRARTESQALLQAEPIALVGRACRVPGGDSPRQFWDLLARGGDAIREVPSDRWDAKAWYDADPAVPAKASTRWGGFLDRIDGFDAGYFGILAREAERMDPQQRLFLEVAIEAFDDAGLPRERLRGSRTGVYVASYHNDYTQLQYADIEAVDARTLTGTLHSVLVNRLSYLLDLRGPSLSLDTACSSSLVAIHLACQSLRLGESDIALAGGVSLMITPDLMVALSKVGFMAPDGRCKAFDARADGFGRGEGCGLVVLKRLADALAEGDRVLAVLRASAVNQDGHSTVLAAPNGLAQQAMIVEAFASAQLDPARVGFVEAHGTGTALGDPIEVEALAATIGRAAPQAGPCLLGSVKANIGHLEAAAGVVGVIKAVLALRHAAIPPQAQFTGLNPHLSLEGTRLAIPTQLTPWPAGASSRIATVSSFGVGGTNAHVILEEAPRLPAAPSVDTVPVARVLTLSAQSPAALRALVEHWIAFLSATNAEAGDLAYSASQRRSHLDCRVAVVGRDPAAWRARLADWLATPAERTVGDAARARRRGAGAAPRIAFVMSGQGPQWFAMGRELLAQEAVFRDVVQECDRLLRPLAGWSLLDELAAGEAYSRLDQTEVAQPALFALQVALCALWKSWGIAPDGVVGHSVGEIAALCAAGVLPMPDAVRVVWHRAREMQQASGLGRMAAVALDAATAADLVRFHGERLSIGAINAPRSVVLSGESSALEAVLATLDARGVSHRLLPVQYAFHSAQMAPFQQRLAADLRGLKGTRPTLDFYSTVSGGLANDLAIDADYIGRNVREPVRFAEAIAAMAREDFDTFVEIGPHPVLSAAIVECCEAAGHPAQVLASLRRGKPERETMLDSAAALYVAGAMPTWSAVQGATGQPVDLPSYPWQHKRYWIRPRPASLPPVVPARDAAGAHALLGTRIDVAGIDSRVFAGDSLSAAYWLGDHRVFGQIVMPGAAILELLLGAARETFGDGAEVSGFALLRPMLCELPGAGRTRWQTVVGEIDGGRAEVTLYVDMQHDASLPQWTPVASGTAQFASPMDATPPVDGRGATEVVDLDAVHARFAELGVAFGPTFRCLNDVRRREGFASGSVHLPDVLEAGAVAHAMHPVMLDAGLQLCSLAAARTDGGELPAAVMLPLGADRFNVLRPVPAQLQARARIREVGAGASLCADVVFETLAQGVSSVVAVIEGMRFARADATAFAPGIGRDDLYRVAWHRHAAPAAATGERALRGSWLLLADRSGVGAAAAQAISAAAGEVLLAQAGERFERLPDGRWIIDPSDPQHALRLVAESTSASKGRLRGVLHFASIDLAPLSLPAGRAVAGADAEDRLAIASLLHLAQALAGREGAEATDLWIVTRGAHVAAGDEAPEGLVPRAAGTWGLAGVIALEHPELRLRCIDLEPVAPASELAENVPWSALLAEDPTVASAPQRQALRGGQRWTPRLERFATRPSQQAAPAVRLEVAQAGSLDGLTWRAVPGRTLRADEVRLRVLASGLNFRDVLMTMGMYPGASVPLGVECAGHVIAVGTAVGDLQVGDRVFGYVPGGLATEVDVPAAFLARIPPGLDDETAAGVPVAFLTASYGLQRLASLRAGQRVLIHAAAGGVGMAAVQIALRCGAEVFATAGSDDKRARLRSLGVAHVMDSRSLDFVEQVRAATGGQGVHVVLNSLAGEFIAASLAVLDRGGCFLELGKRDVMSPAAAAAARPDVRYHLYDLGAEAQADHALLRPLFVELLAALADGSLKPLPVKVFPFTSVSDAMRFMAQARHVGKIVLRPSVTGSAAGPSGAAPIRADGSYLVTGGLGGLGLATAHWLASEGARHLVLCGRHSPDATASQALAELAETGVEVRVAQLDIADREAMRALLDDIARTAAPLRGVIHAAGSLRDGVLLRQSWPESCDVLRGKAHGAWILHEFTRDLPLDLFVLYSAASQLLGAPGQGLYPAANAQLDALASARRRMGLPALSVAWGAWADVGMLARLERSGNDTWASRGLGKLDAAHGFAHLRRLLDSGVSDAAVLPIDWDRFLLQLPAGADRLFFAHLAAARAPAPVASTPEPAERLVNKLRARPIAQRREILLELLTERTRHVLDLGADAPIDPKGALKDYGLDSLMAVELRNLLNREAPRPLPATLLFDYPTLDALASHLAGTWGVELEATPRRLADPVVVLAVDTEGGADAIGDMSDAEAEAALLAELERGAR